MTIKLLRISLDLSARAFGEACGLTGRHVARTVYRWESGDQEPNGASRMLIEQLRAKLSHGRKIPVEVKPSESLVRAKVEKLSGKSGKQRQ